MSFYVKPSRRVPLNRGTFRFGDLDEILEWVDFFQPEDASFAISEFQRLTGLDFLLEYKNDFGRDYCPPTDDVPMEEPIPEPSATFKKEVLFYWGELQHNPKQRQFMVYTTPEDVDAWNKTYAPKTHALSQMDKLDCDGSAPQQLETCAAVQTSDPAPANARYHQVVSVTSAIAELSTGDVLTTASRSVIDTLTQVEVQRDCENIPYPTLRQASEESMALPVQPDKKAIIDMYRGDSPSPRRTRSNSKLDDVLRPRYPKLAPDLIDITDLDQTGRRRLAADKEMICLDYHGRMYAVKAKDVPSALRRLTSFVT